MMMTGVGIPGLILLLAMGGTNPVPQLIFAGLIANTAYQGARAAEQSP